MPRQSVARAAAEIRGRDRDQLGPVFRHLLDRERAADRRYRTLGRPQLLLHALEAALDSGEPVEVPVWRVPVDLRPPGCGPVLAVSPGM